MRGLQKVLSYVRKAVQEYGMIAPGDRLAVGVSGGKDSMLLLASLAALRRFYPVPYTLTAVSIDLCFGGVETDYSPVTDFCARLGVEHHIKRTEIGEIVFSVRKEDSPCSLCAKMRRGALHDFAKSLGCNKICLGHHADDAAETFFMNLTVEGRIGCYSPVTYLSRKDVTVIRPLSLMPEWEIVSAVKRLSIPVVKNPCPADHVGRRQETKELLRGLEKNGCPGLRRQILGAMIRGDVSGWGFQK